MLSDQPTCGSKLFVQSFANGHATWWVTMGRTMTTTHDYLRHLVDNANGIEGALIADLDGLLLESYPKQTDDSLKAHAALCGIALRRLSVSENLAARDEVGRVAMQGESEAFVAMRIGSHLQFIAKLRGPYAVAEHNSKLTALAKQFAGIYS